MKKRVEKSLQVLIVLALVIGLSFIIQRSSAQGSKKLTGEELWGANCNRCHNARMPEEFSDEDWSTIMDHMRVVCGLTGEETKKILEYLSSNN